MAIESALGIAVLVVAFSVLMEIVNVVRASDEMARAARASARGLAFDPAADTCASIRRELHLAADFDCEAKWDLTVDYGVSPQTLPATLDASPQPGTGDLVLVRIGWSHEPWSLTDLLPGEDAQQANTVSKIAMGLARCE